MILLTEVQSMERLFNLDWQLIADSSLTLIAVFVLFLFMSYFLFNPARKLLADRQNRIKAQIDDAKNNMEQAAELRQEYEAKLQNIHKETEKLLSDARRQALANESEILARAKEEAARILEKAQKEALLEKQKAADDMKKEIIIVASAMAGKVVAASMNAEIQELLLDETLKEIGESTWLS